MSEMHQESSGSGDSFDLSQFYQIFFEEAGENLDLMEQMLLNLNLEAADDEELNGIFRCAHSVKGGAATFGFADVAELTHQMESLLDRLRRHELQPNPQMVDVLLESADVSRGLLARHQAGGAGDPLPTADLVRRISLLASGGMLTPEPAPLVQSDSQSKVLGATQKLTNLSRLTRFWNCSGTLLDWGKSWHRPVTGKIPVSLRLKRPRQTKICLICLSSIFQESLSKFKRSPRLAQ